MHTDGVVVIDKPAGMTSHDVVARVRRLFDTKRVGHTGTLDPLATGVLVVCIGQATRIVEYLTAASKEYVAGVVFGVETDSQDATGAVLREADSSVLTAEQLEAVLPGFRGRIRQTPPMVSAVHHEGRRLYELARKGVEVERAAREVEVTRLEMCGFRPGPRARATLTVECSTGTYIRTLAHDIGAALGVGGMMESLRRTRAGAFRLDHARTLEELAALREAGALHTALRSIPDALADWPRVTLTEEEARRIAQGQTAEARGLTADRALLLDEAGAPLALARADGRRLAPFKVLVRSSDSAD